MSGLRLGSVCSGIGGAELAFAGLAESAFASEIDRFPRAVLAHRLPGLPVLGDFRDIGADHAIDVLAGGTPCQSFSVAGLRRGLADERGNLAREFVRLANRLRPRWVLWENVPGVLSNNAGRDFGAILGALVECGYGLAWRSLDAQFFRLAQRRERVFVVGYLGDWRPAGAVLFEPASLRGHPPPGRQARQDVAGTPGGSSQSGGFRTTDLDNHGAFVLTAFGGNNSTGALEVATACGTRCGGRLNFESETFIAHTLRADGFDASEDGTGRGTPLTVALRGRPGGATAELDGTVATALRGSQGGGDKPHVLAFNAREDACCTGDVSGSLGSSSPQAQAIAFAVAQVGSAVRRLTPRECERLQGYPDDWTLIPWRRGMAPDGPRYKALGNAWPVPVARWIARRLAREHAGLARAA